MKTKNFHKKSLSPHLILSQIVQEKMTTGSSFYNFKTKQIEWNLLATNPFWYHSAATNGCSLQWVKTA